MARRIRYDAWPAADGRLTGPGDRVTWTSPWAEPGFRFTDLVASWRARTSGGSWVEVGVQARGSRQWHTLAHWQAGPRATRRTSVPGDPEVEVDTWRPAGGAGGYRLRVRLHPSTGGSLPTLEQVGAVVSAGEVRRSTSPPRRGATRVLDVPRLSQLTWAAVGGRGWCSPTSTSMVLAHAGTLPPRTDTDTGTGTDTDTDTVDVRAAAAEVHDTAYDGTGNWSFNTAWAASLTGHAFVTRLPDLRALAAFVDAGIPLVASVAYPPGALRGAPTRGTNGHLVVLRGFDGDGDVVVNDPAAPSARSVRRTYDRGQLERAWLQGSGGLVYVIHRDDQEPPAAPWTGGHT